MKLKNLSLKTKVFLSFVILFLVSVTTFGVTEIFAEPSIDDLVEEVEIGEFEPNYLFDEENSAYEVTAWLNTTNLIFDYNRWSDTNEDGVIDVEDDIYASGDFFDDMLMYDKVLPIFNTEDDCDYYVTSLSNLDNLNSVIVQMQLGENNTNGVVLSENNYWYDSDTKLLYIDKELIEEDIQNEFYNSIKLETISLVKDIATTTMTIENYTAFSDDIEQLHGIDDEVPNGKAEYNLESWLVDGLKYQLVPAEKLAYISDENLEVYINHEKFDDWYYDETNGLMHINVSPYYTTTVVVKVNELNDVSVTEQALQYLQYNSSEEVGQASALMDALTENNFFLKMLTFYDKSPTEMIGKSEELEFASLVEIDKNKNPIVKNVRTNSGVVQGIPVSLITDEMHKYIQQIQGSAGNYTATTLSGQQMYNKSVAEIYGDIAYNLHLANNTRANATTAVNQVISNLGKFSDKWNVDGIDQMYVVGKYTNKEFLSAKVTDGNAMFELSGAKISASTQAESDAMGAAKQGYETKASIVEVGAVNNSDQGNLIVAVYSSSIDPLNDKTSPSYQRMIGFSKVRYTYHEWGRIQFQLVDSEDDSYFIPGATYSIYSDAACTKLVTTVVTKDAPTLSPVLAEGTYYVKETGFARGFVEDKYSYNTVNGSNKYHKVVVEHGSTTILNCKNDPQYVNFSLQVIDDTTRGYSNEVEVPNTVFHVYDPDSGQMFYNSFRTNSAGSLATDANGNIKTNTNGMISGRVYAKDGYYSLIEVQAADNYHVDNREFLDEEGLIPNPDYCGEISIYAFPDTTGKDLEWHEKHYDKRQELIIKSQVWDENLKEDTPDVLGGETASGSYVTTINAKYQLIPTGEYLLGYTDDGKAIKTTANQPLEVLTRDEYGNETWSKTVTSYSDSGNTVLTVAPQEGKSYIIAEYIKHTFADGTTRLFPIPNGEYKWVMTDASQGYENSRKQETIKDGTWVKEKQEIQYLTYDEVPVIQYRQKIDLTMYVKSYTAATRKAFEPYAELTTTIRNKDQTDNGHGRLIPTEEALTKTAERQVDQFIDTEYKKTVTTGVTGLSSTSKDVATVYKNNSVLYSIETVTNVPNAIYEIYNLNDIIDIKTGRLIPKGTTLGIYCSDENGTIHITGLGTPTLINPNEESKDTNPEFAAVRPISIASAEALSELPNGVYGFALVAGADGCFSEVGLEEDILFETRWTAGTSEIATKEIASAVFLYTTEPIPYIHETIVAPDVPVANPYDLTQPFDPYNPLVPDDAAVPDDNNDIALVSKDWINRNQDSSTYRIIDYQNVATDEHGIIQSYDVADKLPTTFAFYQNNVKIYDKIYDYTYHMSFYYEISEEEYNNASDDAKLKEDVIKLNGYGSPAGIYLQRFARDTISKGSQELGDTIVLNKTSDGFYSYGELKEANLTVSGAIPNTAWLNNRLAMQSSGTEADNEYRVYVLIDIGIEYETKNSNQAIVIDQIQRNFGFVSIKNRELIKLD